MPVAVQVGSKVLGVLKRRSVSGINKLLAKEFRRKNNVSVLRVAMKVRKVRRIKRRLKARR